MGKYAAYKVNIGNISPGRYEQDFLLDTAFFRNMEDADVLDADVKVHMDLDYHDDVYDCVFSLKGIIHIPCDRCLDPMEHEVDTTYNIAVKYGSEYDDSGDDVLVIPESDMFLNVAYMLHDTVILTIPMRHVHPTGKCNRAMSEVLHRHTSEIEDDARIDADIAVDTE